MVPEVLLQFFGGHADAVIGDGQLAVFLVGQDADLEIASVQANLVVGQRFIGQLVDGIAGVGDDFPQEDLFIGVDGVDH